MPATLYSYSDAGAPVMSTSGNGQLYDLLKAVLIDGYGSRTPVGGWTVPFDDAGNKTMVLKNPHHSAYLKIIDNLSYQWCHAYMFRTMTDINTGTDQVPNVTSMGAGQNHFLPKRYTSSGVYGDWHMLVDNDGKWIYYWTVGSSYPSGWFFGDIDLINPSAPFSPTLLTGWSDTSSLSTNDYRYGLFDNANGNWYMQDDRALFGGIGGEEAQGYFDSTSFENPNPADGKSYWQRYGIRTYNTPNFLLGFLPNILRTLGDATVFSDHQIITINSDNYIVNNWNTAQYAFKFDANSG